MGKPAPSVHRPEHPSCVDSRSRAPFINSEFRLGRHWNRADPAVFSYEIDNHPSILTLLHVSEREGGGLGTSQSATDEDRQ